MRSQNFHRAFLQLSRGVWFAIPPALGRTTSSGIHSYITPTIASNPQRLWLLLPLGTFLVLSAYPEEKPTLPGLLASPAIIPPSSGPRPLFTDEDIISSINEPPISVRRRLRDLLRNYVLEPLSIGLRFLHLLGYFLPVMLSSPLLLIGKPDPRHNGEGWGAIVWYDFLTKQMQRAGPTFIKLAQWAASRVDIFPQELCDRFGTLHSTTQPHSFSYTKKVIERVFQKSMGDVFERFEEVPIGSGAIAQVYQATLRKDFLPPSYLKSKHPPKHRIPKAAESVIPQPPPQFVPTACVAVKVLHPKVDKTINRDLKIMSFFAKCIASLPGMEWISLPEEVEVFGKMMKEQLDLRGEADNLQTFEMNFSGRKENAVNFPRPLPEYTDKQVLVEEYEEALPLNSFLRNGGGPFDETLATLGLDVFLNMLLLDNFVHSDLHPGNIMVKFYKPTTSFVLQNIWASISGAPRPEDPLAASQLASSESDAIVARLRPLRHKRKEWLQEMQTLYDDGYQPELVLLDAGLVTALGQQDRRNFLDLFRAIAEFDGYRAGQLMIERCRSPELVVDGDIFALKIQHLALSVKAKTFSLGQIKIADVLSEVLKAVRTHHVKMEADFVNTIVSILLLEGIGRQLDPNMDLFKSALPILRKLGRQVTPSDVTQNTASLGTMLKFWVYIEARELANSAFQDADDFIRYDWMTPNI